MAEVGMYKCKSRIVGAVGESVGVLVETEETAVGAEGGEDSARVAAAAESGVGVNAVGSDIQGVYALLE